MRVTGYEVSRLACYFAVLDEHEGYRAIRRATLHVLDSGEWRIDIPGWGSVGERSPRGYVDSCGVNEAQPPINYAVVERVFALVRQQCGHEVPSWQCGPMLGLGWVADIVARSARSRTPWRELGRARARLRRIYRATKDPVRGILDTERDAFFGAKS